MQYFKIIHQKLKGKLFKTFLLIFHNSQINDINVSILTVFIIYSIVFVRKL
jgi:hypothetical protein